MTACYADVLRPIPNPYNTYEEWRQYNCDDITAMCRGDLLADLTACRMRTAYEGRSTHWWISLRIAALENALAALEGQPAPGPAAVDQTVTGPSATPAQTTTRLRSERPQMREFRGGQVVTR